MTKIRVTSDIVTYWVMPNLVVKSVAIPFELWSDPEPTFDNYYDMVDTATAMAVNNGLISFDDYDLSVGFTVDFYQGLEYLPEGDLWVWSAIKRKLQNSLSKLVAKLTNHKGKVDTGL